MLTRIQSDALAMCKSIEIPEEILMPSSWASIDEEIMSSNGEDYFDFFTMGVSNAWTDYQIVHAYETRCRNRGYSEIIHENSEELGERYDALCELDYCNLSTEQKEELSQLEDIALDSLSYYGDEMRYDLEVSELGQVWIDCKTGDVVYLLKFNRDLDEINDDYPFCILDPNNVTDAARITTIKRIIGSCFFDVNVNPLLTKRGYEGIRIFPDIDNYDDMPNNGYIRTDWIAFMCSAIRGEQTERDMKQYTLPILLYSMGIEDDEERQAFLTACRICRRHKYSPYKEKYGYVSLNRYREYVSRLLYFHKDVHNPHYVCPADFDAAEEEITRKYNRLMARQRIAEEHRRQIERMAKDKKAIAAFEQRMARYSDLRFATTNFYIVPCTTADAMMHEGEVMHHCVFEMRYFAKENSQIWLVRRPDGSPISTIELNTECWSIVQNRGKYNAVPDFLAESNSLLMANIETIQKKFYNNIKTVAA